MKINVNPDAKQAAQQNVVSSASVPISVYRELTAELQATQVMLESLNAQNQQLAQQNQQLRKEVERVVQLGLNLRHWVEAPPPVDAINANLNTGHPHSPAAPSGLRQPSAPSPSPEAAAAASAIAAKLRTPDSSEPLFTEAAALPHSNTDTKPARDFSGVWLTLTILLIVVSAFGAGFLVMKPLLSGNR